ncbi:MAG: hypothetical protein GWN79_12575, partial [Actinobacteria bacterium]|nr:hypothetical protein [Actinomycetota bacterium]NIT96190.1 hypothetical protein [Actinomycetota bacterium]NIU19875.1 hypothetical protein [Actinomycetota bacterium]NIU67324.1 hypothetical protein [Actinomycetota bacterium]NIV56348.1 hypothetical protein [Actinomycetota bacterium]
ELFWITGYRAEMVSEDKATTLSQEYMCHSNLDFKVDPHREAFGWRTKSV